MLSLNAWKNQIKQLDVHFSHILKAVRFPKMASKLELRILQFSEGRMAALKIWGAGNCHSFCTILELMSAPEWLLNLSLGRHLFIFT